MTESCEVAIVGSGFAGSLLARVLAVLGYDVVLIERGTHPRFAIGESSTPLANLSLERLGTRYGLADCYHLATHGRWLEHHADLRRGLKRGFTFYRHHPGEEFANRGYASERLLVAASPENRLADTHWLRSDVDHHFVRQAVAAGVDYRDRTNLTGVDVVPTGMLLHGDREGVPISIRAGFVVDASGPAGFLARQLAIPSALERTHTRSALLFGHFDGVALLEDVIRDLPPGPYPDDWAAVHHLIDEGWMYSLRFDHGITSAGFLLRPGTLPSLGSGAGADARAVWTALLRRYPTLDVLFGSAKPMTPIGFQPAVQHRLARAAGECWAMLPHAFAFVDPLFSTGIAWSLRAVERLALEFEDAKHAARRPAQSSLHRYEALLAAEADQIDCLVAGAYIAMAHFELFTAQAMLYFAAVSFAEVSQRLTGGDLVGWSGFLGVDDDVLAKLPAESLARLQRIVGASDKPDTTDERRDFAAWIARAIAPRNVAGLADPERRNLYPADLDTVLERCALLGMTTDEMTAALPALRGMSPDPSFGAG